MVAEGVIEPVGEIGRTNHQGELDDLPFVVMLPQLFERAAADNTCKGDGQLGTGSKDATGYCRPLL